MPEPDNFYAHHRGNPLRTRPSALKSSPPRILASGFLILIAIGTVLLWLPISTSTTISLYDALFMATSAVTITGLAVIDTAQELTAFGKSVLILLVQLGGLGFVTFAILTALALGKKLSLQQQAIALEAFNQTRVSTIRKTALTVIKITLTIQAVVALILTLWWWREMPFTTALTQGVFHAITAFNNCGFSLFDKSLALFADDAVIIATITASIILGGIGFSVLNDVHQTGRWRTLTPYTKAILLATLALNLFGFIMIWLLENDNPGTLGDMTAFQQILAAWMQSVTSRTAGFTSIDITQLRDSTTLILMFLMFIGGGSLSTASGIKVGTFIVLIAAMWSFIRQRTDVVVLNRSIETETVHKSLALVVVTSLLAISAVFMLTLFETRPFLDLMFETISALSTTGMSRDVTPALSGPGKAVLMVVMFAGRIGPLTLVYSLAVRRHTRVRYPTTEFPVG